MQRSVFHVLIASSCERHVAAAADDHSDTVAVLDAPLSDHGSSHPEAERCVQHQGKAVHGVGRHECVLPYVRPGR